MRHRPPARSARRAPRCAPTPAQRAPRARPHVESVDVSAAVLCSSFWRSLSAPLWTGLVRRAAEHPDAGPKLKAAGVTLQLTYTDPDSQLTVTFADPMEIVEGDTDRKPDVQLFMAADIADKFWRG